MFRGFEYAIPMEFVALCTIGFGGFIGSFAWCIVAFDSSGKSDLRRTPLALWTFSASVVSVVVGEAVLSIVPDAWEQYHAFGARLRPVVFLVFLILSFAFVIVSVVLLRGRVGHAKGILLIGSIGLILVNIFGIVGFILALPEMPLH